MVYPKTRVFESMFKYVKRSLPAGSVPPEGRWRDGEYASKLDMRYMIHTIIAKRYYDRILSTQGNIVSKYGRVGMYAHPAEFAYETTLRFARATRMKGVDRIPPDQWSILEHINPDNDSRTCLKRKMYYTGTNLIHWLSLSSNKRQALNKLLQQQEIWNE